MDSIKPLTMRGGSTLGRTAIAVQTNSGVPCKLWSTYTVGAKTYLATSESVDVLPSAWTINSLIGENLLDATIVFDGTYIWKNYKWAIYTEDIPWVFYITSDGILHAKHGTSITDLATGVSNVVAIRGWKNPNFIDRDQGIIVAYIKNATIYYRNYCVQAGGTLLWEAEKSLAHKAGSVLRLTMASLNDYRVCFSVEDTSGNISWALTPRNWAGMAIRPEKITANPQCSLGITKVMDKQGYVNEKITVLPSATLSILYGATANSITSVYNIDNGSGDWGRFINFSIEHATINVPSCVLTDTTLSTDIGIAGITKISETSYQIEIAASEYGINVVVGAIRLNITNAINQAGIKYDDMSSTFTPNNLVPPYTPPPEVEEIWNE